MSLPEIKTLKDTLKDEMRAKSVSVAKLAELTGISISHIQALIESNFERLPAAPYVRGYLQKIAEVLEIDADIIWRRYEKESAIKRSGKTDTLPHNRYALHSVHKGMLWLVAAGIIILIIAIPALVDFFGKPSLQIDSPAQETEITTTSPYTVSGNIQNSSDRVFINETEVLVSEQGEFSIQKDLDEGVNTFVIRAQRFLGKSTTITRNVFYQSGAITIPTTTPSSTQETPDEQE
jgi:cytoskeletal protein RodZ